MSALVAARLDGGAGVLALLEGLSARHLLQAQIGAARNAWGRRRAVDRDRRGGNAEQQNAREDLEGADAHGDGLVLLK